jgi:Domain of unknown function (DUF5076)
MNERPIPEAAMRDKNSVEMLRVWIAERGLHCSMKVGMYLERVPISEEKAWGILLADVTLHLASALEQGYSRNRFEVIQKVQLSYLEELSKPTSSVEGGFVQQKPQG